MVLLGKHAGFCYGVDLALKTVYNHCELEKLCTYGPVIHNKHIVDELAGKGVEVINDLKDAGDRTVVIRAHGIPKQDYDFMSENGIKFLDCTCPNVKEIHKIVEREYSQGKTVIIVGDENHPEVKGINGFAENTALVVNSTENIPTLNPGKPHILVIQTTFIRENFENILNILKKSGTDITIYDTICNATAVRQNEAVEIAKQVDVMLILGDKQSSNTQKLHEICAKHCGKTFLAESIADFELNNFNSNDKIGITAGASTPPVIIKEAFFTMSELENTTNPEQSFSEMLDESFVTLHTGDVVKGTVIQVSNGEVSVNLGYKSDGVIPRSEFSDDNSIDPANQVKPGDEIEVFVVRVNDGEGNVTLSKKKVDANKNMSELEAAFTEQRVVSGKIIDIVKGGLIALINEVRVFVPSSQISNRFVEDLTQFKGQTLNFNIIDFDKDRRRIVAGRKALSTQELNEKREKVFAELKEGQTVEGVVTRIVDFGAFVDIGGVDGLIHISELSWGRVSKVTDVLSIGNKVTATVLAVNPEKGKISLSLRSVENDPWANINERFPVGKVVTGKVVRMVPFGAFIELADGLDGLMHISQISDKHIEKPEDVLSVGETVEVAVTAIDPESKRISLSKKAVKAEAEAEAAVEAAAPAEETPENNEATPE